MKIKKSVLFISAASLLLFSACKNQNKQKLELSFGNNIEFVDISYLESAIGTGNGSEETFGEQKSMLLFFAEDDCSTCKKVQPVVENWIQESGIKVYGYIENPAGDINQNQKMLKKLGSSDGVNLTAGRLIAFEKGKRTGSISGTFDLESTEKIQKFVENRYILTKKSTLTVNSLKKLNGLSDLRKSLDNNENFLLYFERHSCPDCRQLSNPNGQDIITKIAQNYKGNLYKIVTEDSLYQLSKPVTVDGINYSSAFEYFQKSGTDQLLWNENESLKKKTEYIEMLVALKQIKPYSSSDENFLKEIYTFARKADDKFLPEDRNVPSFAVVNNNKTYDKDKIKSILQTAYQESNMIPENKNLHRISFEHYFSPDNTVISSEIYQDLLINYTNVLCNSQ